MLKIETEPNGEKVKSHRPSIGYAELENVQINCVQFYSFVGNKILATELTYKIMYDCYIHNYYAFVVASVFAVYLNK